MQHSIIYAHYNVQFNLDPINILGLRSVYQVQIKYCSKQIAVYIYYIILYSDTNRGDSVTFLSHQSILYLF